MIDPNVQELLVGANEIQGFKRLKMKQYDKNLREFRISLIEDGSVSDIPSNYVVKFQATKPDGTIILDDCTVENDIVVYRPREQLSNIAGTVKCELGFYVPDPEGDANEDGLIQSVTFEILVEKSAMDRNAVVSSNEFNTLTIMINTITGLIESVTTALSQVENIIATEASRVTAENGRVSSEGTRVSNENTRVGNENTRVSSESTRVSSENTRVSSESTRVIKENERLSAETTRLSNENTRQTFYNAYKGIVTYNPATAYIVGNKVTSQGGTYQNIVACTGIVPTYNTDNANWKCIAAKGSDGAGGDMFKSVYDPSNKALNMYAHDTKDDTVTFTESATLDDISSGNTHSSLFGKILKWIKTLRTRIGDLTQLTTTSNTDLVGAINEVNGQLAETVSITRYSSYAIDGDYSLAIAQACVDNVDIVFPSGTYNIKTHLLISNKSNFKWIANGKVVLYDLCQAITKVGGGTAKNVVGIEFNTCKDFSLEGLFYYDSDTEVTGEIATSSEAVSVPHIDFVNCTNHKIIGSKFDGIVGGYYGDGARFNTLPDAPAYFMKSGYTRNWGCHNVEYIDCEIVSGSTGGEYFQFYDCDTVKFIGCYHVQGESLVTFDSFAKIINCTNVEIDKIHFESNSVGSGIEISGSNFFAHNCTGSYTASINGFFTLSRQWGLLNGDIKHCYFKDNIVDTKRMFGMSSNLLAPVNPLMDDIIIENCIETGYTDTTAVTADLPVAHIANITLKNKKYKNVQSVCYNETALEFNNDYARNMKLYDSEITTDKANLNSVVQLEAYKGVFEISNTKINLNGYNSLTLLDRSLSFSGINCDTSKTEYIFNDCEISNCIVTVRANTTFNRCRFNNVYFTSIATIIPTIIWNNCILKYSEIPETPLSTKIFNFLSFKKLEYNNCTLLGKHKNSSDSVFAIALDKAGDIYINGGNYDLIRYVSDVSEVNSNLFTVVNANINANIYINGATLGTHQNLFYLTGTTNAGAKVTYHVKNCNLQSTTALTDTATSVNRINLFLQNNIGVGTEIADIITAAAKFNNLKYVGNLEL